MRLRKSMHINSTQKPKIVAIGGGTGTSTIISGLATYPAELTAIVSMADSGGSTGRLRDEFGFQPVGDVRQSLVALVHEKQKEWIRKILLYRFSKGNGLQGHNLGNLLLTALQDMTGSTARSLEIIEETFHLQGKVLPITEDNVQLQTTFTDGSTVMGEDYFNTHSVYAKRINSISLVPSAHIFRPAFEAIEHADCVVIGPGDYYASLLATLCVDGVKEAFGATTAKIIFVVNLMTTVNQTRGMPASAHIQGIEKAIGRKIDLAICNTGKIPANLLAHYAQNDEFPVEIDTISCSTIAEDYVLSVPVHEHTGDVLERSYLRHDPTRIAQAIWRSL
ncbi:MAG: hypothetical protein UX04_C0001G0124 [Microgenomates group bacterium GW2011_GWF2_45_18]|nr:MAG: hypothetical protein UX04_C0001G0124 [Microgenomates group bacterium GW2011_GWF2_45_18]